MQRRPTPPPGRRSGLRPCLAGLVPALLVLCLNAQGQEAAPARQPPLLLKFTPQYLVVSGFWLEVERGWRRHPGQSFTVTPQLYAGPAGRPDKATPYYQSELEPEKRVRGAGVQVQHRVYLRAGSAAPATGLYASYGASFQHFQLSYSGLGWQQVQDPNGLPYLEYRSGRHTEKTNRYGATGQAGYQLPLGPTGRFVLDVYAGLGWRTGKSRGKTGPIRSQYRSGPSDYGHLGWYFPAGFKLGVALR